MVNKIFIKQYAVEPIMYVPQKIYGSVTFQFKYRLYYTLLSHI